MSNVSPSVVARLLSVLMAFFGRWFTSPQAQVKGFGPKPIRQSKGAGGMLGARAAPYCPRPDWPYHVLARLGHRAPRSHQKRLGWA